MTPHIYLPLATVALLLLCRLSPLAMRYAQVVLGHKRLLTVAAVGGFSGMAYDAWVTPLWHILSRLVLACVYGLLWLCGQSVPYEINKWGDGVFHVDKATINVMAGCSGLEGMAMMAFVLSVVILVERWENRNLWAVYGIGLALMFLANVIRIASIILVAGASPDAVGYFHSNAGWVLYVFVIAGYLKTLYRLRRTL